MNDIYLMIFNDFNQFEQINRIITVGEIDREKGTVFDGDGPLKGVIRGCGYKCLIAVFG